MCVTHLTLDSYLNPINPFNPANLKEHEDVVALKQKQNQTITPFSCKRQKFEAKCEGTKRTQIVLRWFAKNGECCSYPYGFCPGEASMCSFSVMELIQFQAPPSKKTKLFARKKNAKLFVFRVRAKSKKVLRILEPLLLRRWK